MQYPFGVARISYPRTVAMSDADPATAVALPARVRRIPGGISRPVRIGDDTTDFFSATQDALLRSARVLQVLDPNTPASAYPARGFGSTGIPQTLSEPVTMPSWVLPTLVFGGIGLALVMALGKR